MELKKTRPREISTLPKSFSSNVVTQVESYVVPLRKDLRNQINSVELVVLCVLCIKMERLAQYSPYS